MKVATARKYLPDSGGALTVGQFGAQKTYGGLWPATLGHAIRWRYCGSSPLAVPWSLSLITQLVIAGAAVAMRHAVAQKLSNSPVTNRTRLSAATTGVAISSTRSKVAVFMSKSPQILIPKAYVL